MTKRVDLISVHLVPSIAFDYEARGVFPAARLQERPGRVPQACDVSLPRETAEAMLADASTRPEQLKREQGNFKGGAVMAWRRLVHDLEWALLTDNERFEREQEKEAQQRGAEWRCEVLRSYAWNDPIRELARQLADLPLDELAGRVDRFHKFAVENGAVGWVPTIEGVYEAELEQRLDTATWRLARALLNSVSRAAVTRTQPRT